VGVAFLIIFTNLPSPEADFASMPLIAVAMLTNTPLFLAYFALKIYQRVRGYGKQQSNSREVEMKEVVDERAVNTGEDKPMILRKLDSIDEGPVITI
jgi:hypothetical protein